MSDFIIQIEKLVSAISDAEYRYLLLEPLIFYGILIGVGMLVCGFFMKAPKLQIAALIVVGISAFAHVPYKEARVAAQPRMEQVYKISSPSRVKGFKENTESWIASSWKFKFLVLSAGLALMIGINRNRIGYGLGIVTACLGLIAAKDAMWLHYQDALAYHPNLKRHDAPIDRKAPPASRTADRSTKTAPAKTATPAGSVAASPQSVSPYNSPGNGSAVSSLPRDRIAAPTVPEAPRARPVTPIR